MLTNNTRRAAGDENGPNPRAPNPMGRIVEITEDGNDNGANTFRWEIFMRCSDPADEAQGAYFAGFDTSRVSKIANPDALAFDRRRNMLIATDGQPRRIGINGGVLFVPTEGPERGFNRQIFSGVTAYIPPIAQFQKRSTILMPELATPVTENPPMRKRMSGRFQDFGPSLRRNSAAAGTLDRNVLVGARRRFRQGLRTRICSQALTADTIGP